MRSKALEAGTWPGSRFASIPEPAWLVEHLHSHNMNRVYGALKEIAEGKFNRPAGGGRAAVVGKAEGTEARASESAIWYAVGAISNRKDGDHLPAPSMRTLKRMLHRLVAVHSIVAYERGQASTREAITYKLPAWGAVLEARRANPAIATTSHGKGMQWSNGRPSSRRPLTPEQARDWKLYEIPARDASSSESVSEPGVVAREPAPDRETPDRAARAAPAGRVTAEQLAALSALCGREVDAKIANQILEAAEAAATRDGKVFPPEGLIDLNPKGTHGLCNRVFERKHKLVEEKQYDQEAGRYRDVKRFEWRDVANPPGYILRAVADVDLVGPFVNDWDAALKRGEAKQFRDDYEAAHACLEKLDRQPADVRLQARRDDLMRKNPAAFQAAYQAFTAKRPAAPDPPALAPLPKDPKFGRELVDDLMKKVGGPRKPP